MTSHSVLPWRWWYALAGYVAISTAMIVPSLLPLQPGTAVPALLPFVLFAALSILVPRLFAGRVRASDLGLVITDAKRMLIIGLAIWALFTLAGMAWEAAHPSSAQAGVEGLRMSGLGQGVSAELVLILMIGIAAPVGEELIYRGLIFRSLRDGLARFGRPIALGAALLISSALFIELHLTSGSNAQIVQYALFALCMALAYQMSGSLLTAIGAHSLNNAFVLSMGLSQLETSLAAPWLYGLLWGAPILAVGLAWLIGFLLPTSQS